MKAAKINYTTLVEEKIADLKSQIATMKTNEAVSKNTRGTQLYKLGRERRVLHLINALLTQIEDVKLEKDDLDTFVLVTTLSEERANRTSIEVKEGDNILELMQKYEDKKDLQKKLVAACEKAGLKLDYSTGKVVKA
jgi:hypothetical protein